MQRATLKSFRSRHADCFAESFGRLMACRSELQVVNSRCDANAKFKDECPKVLVVRSTGFMELARTKPQCGGQVETGF